MKIEAGKYYQNSKGAIRKVIGQVENRHRWGNGWLWEYAPILPGGKEGSPRRCAASTMSGWAKREWDPTAADFISPKRDQACKQLIQIMVSGCYSPSDVQSVINLTVEAAKEELRKELGL